MYTHVCMRMCVCVHSFWTNIEFRDGTCENRRHERRSIKTKVMMNWANRIMWWFYMCVVVPVPGRVVWLMHVPSMMMSTVWVIMYWCVARSCTRLNARARAHDSDTTLNACISFCRSACMTMTAASGVAAGRRSLSLRTCITAALPIDVLEESVLMPCARVTGTYYVRKRNYAIRESS